jgi:ketosteroid isomerase-like protein
MSGENVEVVRGFYDAFARGDLESALAAFDPEVVAHDHDIPDSGEYRGLEGLLRWRADWESSWESWRWEPQELVQAGDRVVAVLRVHARGRGSGVDVERLDGAVWTLRAGRCVRLDYYGSDTEALEAVGLRG